MAKRETVLLDKGLCDDLLTITLERPDGWEYRAGQWFTLSIPTSEGEQQHTFSHASAPSEAAIMMATRVSPSAYKQALVALEPGTRVWLGGPGGRLAMPDSARVVLLTGGVGVTPFRGLLVDALDAARRFADLVLLYGSRTPECVAYLSELERLAEPLSMRIVPVYEAAGPEWEGERGFITTDMVRRHVDLAEKPAFMISGPPLMVDAMGRVLDELDVSPDARTVESFGRS